MIDAVQTYGLRDIQNIEAVLSKTPAVFFAASGTLLGFVRDGRLIDWDSDLDYGIFIDEEFSWEDLERELNSIGFHLDHQYSYRGSITEQTYVNGDVLVDFFEYYSDQKNSYFNAYYHKKNYKYSSKNQIHVQLYTLPLIIGTEQMDVMGVSVHVPNNSELYLEHCYGKTWREPNPEWKLGDSPACRLLGDDDIGFYEKFGD